MYFFLNVNHAFLGVLRNLSNSKNFKSDKNSIYKKYLVLEQH